MASHSYRSQSGTRVPNFDTEGRHVPGAPLGLDPGAPHPARHCPTGVPHFGGSMTLLKHRSNDTVGMEWPRFYGE